MHLTYHVAKPSNDKDFADHYRSCFPRDQKDAQLRVLVRREWDIFLASPTTTTILVEDSDRPATDRVVGCGQGVFITEKFAQLLDFGLPPWVNEHATRSLPDGSCPLLSKKGIGVANGGEGINALLSRWTILDSLTNEESMSVRVFMHGAFGIFTKGHKLKALWVQATGGVALQEAERAGFQLVNDYADYYRHKPVHPDSHPYLLKITRETALSLEGSLISHAFAYTPPRCFFKPHEQEVLILARDGLSSAEIAAKLNLTVWAVNKRWDKIYERVEIGLPKLLTPPANIADQSLITQSDGKKHGPHKIRALLKYLETHPEELRPYVKPVARKTRSTVKKRPLAR